MKKPILCLIISISFIFSSFGQTRVLFLGNSYTAGNNLSNIFKNLSEDGGHSIIVDRYTAGGQTLDGHSTNNTAQSKIRQGNWDVIILQEQSQIPTIPFYKESLMYPAARRLEDTIRKYNPCAKIMMFMTWGRRFGGQQCDSDGTYCSPSFVDFTHMQDSLESSYVGIANEIGAAVAPVGIAWKNVIENTSTVLHTGDNSHPNGNGSYVAACVFYAMIWKESPEGLIAQAGVSDELASDLQEVAKQTVFESESDWNIDIDLPNVDFSYETTENTVNFQNEAENSIDVNYHWDFGDGMTSEEESPSHTYTEEGVYTVKLTITDSECSKSKSYTEEISIDFDITTNIEEGLQKTDFILFPNPSSETLQVKSKLFLEKSYQLTILDNFGKDLSINQSNFTEIQHFEINNLPKGQYFLKIQDNKNKPLVLRWVKN